MVTEFSGSTYSGMHVWLYRELPKASTYSCASCEGPAKQWSNTQTCTDQQWGSSNSTGPDSPWCRHQEHYVPMCVPCHIRHDHRDYHQNRANRVGSIYRCRRCGVAHAKKRGATCPQNFQS